MCLIIAKIPNLPLTEQIYPMIEGGAWSNDDGMGYMLKRSGDNYIYIKKGITKISEAIIEIESLDIQPCDEFVFHLRMATSGLYDTDNCHPFVVSTKSEEVLWNNCFVRKPCLTHNGIFSEYSNYGDAYSDTYYFTKDFFARYGAGYREKVNNYLKRTMFGNKVAVLFPQPDKPMMLLGNFQIDENYYVSNKGYNFYGFSKNKKETFEEQKFRILRSEDATATRKKIVINPNRYLLTA